MYGAFRSVLEKKKSAIFLLNYPFFFFFLPVLFIKCIN